MLSFQENGIAMYLYQAVLLLKMFQHELDTFILENLYRELYRYTTDRFSVAFILIVKF